MIQPRARSASQNRTLSTAGSTRHKSTSPAQSQAVTAAGLTMGQVQEFPSSTYDEGRVSYQSIAAFKEVNPGTTINFWVSTGSGEEPSPSPSLEPSPSPDISPDPMPSETQAITVQKIIEVDLSRFEEDMIPLRVEVGGRVVFNGMVDKNLGRQTIPVEGSGRELVEIYNGEERVDSYILDFTQ